MWASSVDGERLQRVNTAQWQNQWHRGDPQPDAERLHAPHPTEEVEEQDFDPESQYTSGTWGERDVGGFNEEEAAAQFAALRRNLTQLSRTRSKETTPSLKRTISARSGLSRRQTLERPRTARTASVTESVPETPGTEEVDLEAGEKKEDEEEEDLELDQFLREGHFEKRSEDSSAMKVGVVF